MTRGTVPAAGTGRRSEPGYPPAESAAPTTDSARAQPSTRRCTCPRVPPYAASTFAGRAAPAPHGSDFRRPALVPCASRHSPTYRLVYRTCRDERVVRSHIYEPISILTHGSLDLIDDRRTAFSAALVGNQLPAE